MDNYYEVIGTPGKVASGPMLYFLLVSAKVSERFAPGKSLVAWF